MGVVASLGGQNMNRDSYLKNSAREVIQKLCNLVD